MLHIIKSISQVQYSQLMSVYEESNLLDAQKNHTVIDKKLAMINAEQDLYHYLASVFFRTSEAALAVWVEGCRYVSCLRYEPYLDGYLITALESAPGERGKGYAKKLLTSVLEKLTPYRRPVYSHVERSNTTSFAIHIKCGFLVASEEAIFLDGTKHPECSTMIYETDPKQRSVPRNRHGSEI